MTKPWLASRPSVIFLPGFLLGLVQTSFLLPIVAATLPFLSTTTVSSLLSSASLLSSRNYTAGSVQFYPLGNLQQTPAAIIELNLQAFDSVVRDASSKQVDILVFSEGSLGWIFGETYGQRDKMLPYCETVPAAPAHNSDTNNTRRSAASVLLTCPCDHPEQYTQRPQLLQLSRFAKRYALVLVVNMCDVQWCRNTSCATNSPSCMPCPADGRWQYNADVVFDEKGCILAKYHKAHLFDGAAVFDQPHSVSPVSFTTSFGVTFGLFICYDLEFQQPLNTLFNLGIRDFVFSSWWINTPPLDVSIQYQQALSLVYKINLIAANTGQFPYNGGGGIYAHGDVQAVLFSGEEEQVQTLLVGHLSSPSPPLNSSIASSPSVPPFSPSPPPPPPPPSSSSSSPSPAITVPCQVVMYPSSMCGLLHLNPRQSNKGQITVSSPPTSSSASSSSRVQCALDYVVLPNKLFGLAGANETWALMATDGLLSANSLRNNLTIQACTLLRCQGNTAMTKNTTDSLVCEEIALPLVAAPSEGRKNKNKSAAVGVYATIFSYLRITSRIYNPDHLFLRPFPMLAFNYPNITLLQTPSTSTAFTSFSSAAAAESANEGNASSKRRGKDKTNRRNSIGGVDIPSLANDVDVFQWTYQPALEEKQSKKGGKREDKKKGWTEQSGEMQPLFSMSIFGVRGS